MFNTDKKQQGDGEQFISWAEFHKGWFNTQVVPEFVDLRKLWDNLSKDDNNMVSSKVWGEAVAANQDLMKALFGGSTLKEIGTYFNVVDENADKHISWVEIAKGYSKANEVSELKQVFMEMDRDGSGFVDGKEWGQQLNKFKDKLGNFFMGKTLKELGGMFNTIDTNEDGQMSWLEIVQAVRADQNKREEQEELAAVAKIDAVNDAKLSFLEKNLVFKKKADS